MSTATKHKNSGKKQAAKQPANNGGDIRAKKHKIDTKTYEKELARLQVELVKLQEWVKHEGLKVVVEPSRESPPA